MTTTYSQAAVRSTDEAAVERAVRAIVDRLGQALTQGTTRDIGADASMSIPTGSTPYDSAAPDAQRWMVPLLGQLAQIVAQSAPAILQGITQQNRDIFGTTTRDAQAVERDFASLFSAIVPHLTQALPTIAQLFAGRRDMPQNDEEMQSRWLLPLLGAVLPTIVQAVPGIVSSLTQGRGVTPSLTDPNEATRWFGPILSAIVPQVIASLPSIASIFD
jgi:hypothetical protein